MQSLHFKVKSRLLTIMAILLSLILFSGCSLTTDINTLLSPPALSPQQNEIYSALTSALNNNKISLKYPKNGEYRSAIILADIDDEPTSEAIVFYTIESKEITEGTVRINILDLVDGKWKSVCDIAGDGTDVDRVVFDNIGGTDAKDILISFSALTGDEISLCAYTYTYNHLVNNFSTQTNTFLVLDLDNDSSDEIITIRNNTEISQAYISMVDRVDDRLIQTSGAFLDMQSEYYTNIVSGYIGKNTLALFIDGVRGKLISTEIIYCVDGELRNPVYNNSIIPVEMLLRPVDYPSLDIDNDKVIEIPTLDYFPGYTNLSEKLYITNWNYFDNYSIVKKYSSYFNYAQKYCFIIPSRWTGVVTAKVDAENNITSFYKYNSSVSKSTELLLEIKTVTKNSTENTEDFTLIRSSNYADYYVKVPENEKEPLILTLTEILNNFYTIS